MLTNGRECKIMLITRGFADSTIITRGFATYVTDVVIRKIVKLKSCILSQIIKCSKIFI